LKFAQICPKLALKYTIFINIQKRPNGQTILFLANSFKKGQMATLGGVGEGEEGKGRGKRAPANLEKLFF